MQFSLERQIDPLQAPPQVYLDFLHGLLERGLGYSAINSAHSAILMFRATCNQNEQPITPWIVSKFLRGIYSQTRPPQNKCHLGCVHSARFLSHTESLICFVPHSIVSEISNPALTSIRPKRPINSFAAHRKCKMQQCNVSSKMGDLLKSSRPGYHLAEIRLPAYPNNPALCVVQTYKAYVNRTKTLRGKTKNLFIRTVRPYSPISRDTFSHWVKRTLTMAGIDMSTFTPHSTRAAATSAAYKAKVPLLTILSTAGWTRECTFRQFYNKPVTQKTTFASNILKVHTV